jgi:undecaprenyl-diphosphatase
MTDVWSLVILGLVQGMTEFLPVSSSGHLILAREVFHLSTENGLAIDAVLQLATVFAVVVYFWSDLWALLTRAQRSTLYAIILGTIPAVVLGVFLEGYMETAFRSAELVAYTLIAGSVVLLLAEYVPKPTVAPRWWLQGIVVGLFQALALVPGMSRSGMTIAGGMFVGLTRSDAARFGFLLSVPILLGSGLKKFADLGTSGVLDSMGLPLIAGALVAFVSGLLAIYLLLALVRKTPLTVFVVYRVVLAVLILTLI